MNPAHLDPTSNGQPLLSVIVPVYNEKLTIERVLPRLLQAPYPDKQIIVVDDGSDDGTNIILERWIGHPNILVLHHSRNQGKGAAVRTALDHARGTITIIQDADLEYDPEDWPRLIEPIRHGEAIVVYGSRYLHPSRSLPWSKFRLAVSLLNGLVGVLYGRRLSDEATCYKAMPTALFRALDLRSQRFELCAEITAKVCRLRLPILEVPISYKPRTAAEGKKIGWRDAWSTFWTLLQWRFLLLRRPQLIVLPSDSAKRRSADSRQRNASKFSDCAPSDSAWSGSGYTSMSRPSAPAASAARAIAGT